MLRTADIVTLEVKQRRVLRRGAAARTVDAAVIVSPWTTSPGRSGTGASLGFGRGGQAGGS